MSGGLHTEAIERARETRIEEIIESRGVKLRGRIDRCGPCPVCGGVDRFAVNTRKQVFLCRKCGLGGDVIGLVRFLDGVDFRSAIETLSGERIVKDRPRQTRPRPPVKPADRSNDDAKRLERDLAARRIASEIGPLIGTHGAVYLRDVRKIDVGSIEDVLTPVDALRWRPAVYFNEPGHAMHGQRLGCIVGIMSDVKTAQPTGAISRTYIGPDLAKLGKAKTLGAPTGIVRLSRDDEVLAGLFLAEGIETALAAMSLGLRPCWSTGSTALMRSFPVLNGIEAISVVVDHDLSGAGERAARELEARWLAAGREVNLLRPGALGDLNDSLKGGG